MKRGTMCMYQGELCTVTYVGESERDAGAFYRLRSLSGRYQWFPCIDDVTILPEEDQEAARVMFDLASEGV